MDVTYATRTSPRVPLKLRVDWWVDGSLCHFVSRTEDLSRGGLFIGSLSPMQIGTRLRMRIPVQGREAAAPIGGSRGAEPPDAIELSGTVVHRRAHGMGVSIDR